MTIEEQTIFTQSGKKFPLYGSMDSVDVDDIAHALSMQCRFTGHLREFYSVAQHSVWVARWLQKHGFSRECSAIGLFHDASEAYLSDLARPFKGEVKGYKMIELVLQSRIMHRFGLPAGDERPALKIADKLACFVEARDLHAPDVWEDFRGLEDEVCIPGYRQPGNTGHTGFAGTFYQLVLLEPKLHPWTPEHARWVFKDWYNYFKSRDVVL